MGRKRLKSKPTKERPRKQQHERPRVKLSWRKKIIFAIIPLLMLLGIAEVICRLTPRKDKFTQPGIVQPDPDLLWSLRPPGNGYSESNELNLRDTPYNANADVKVLVLGDSVTWGDGVFLTGTYPYHLEQYLNHVDAPKTYEVINAGVLGYSTFQEAAYLKLRGIKLNPDMIVLQFCLNDLVERYTTLAEYGGDNVFLGIDTRKSLTGAYGFLWRHSHAFERLARYLQTRSRNREEYDVKKLAQDKLSPALEEAWDQTLAEIEEIRQTAVEYNIPLLIVIAPYRFQLADESKLRQPQDRLLAYAKSHNVPCLDLLPFFTKAKTQEPLFHDKNHFSDAGHLFVAKVLVKPVLQILKAHKSSGNAATQP